MTKGEWPFAAELAPIPPEFHSLQLDGPFQRCVGCDAELLSGDEPYLIERVFRGSEPIIEYAMCMNCQLRMRSELSLQSVRSVDRFLAELDYHPRIERLQQLGHTANVTAWLDECLVTGKNRADCREYQIFALCRGSQMAVGNLPGMLSGEAVERITELLSQKTRDRLDDFVGENFGMPPEFCESPNFTPLLV